MTNHQDESCLQEEIKRPGGGIQLGLFLRWGFGRLSWGKRLRRLEHKVDKLEKDLLRVTGQVADLTVRADALEGHLRQIAEILRTKGGRAVVFQTTGGEIAGIVIEVGEDYVKLSEPTGDLVLIPLQNILTFSDEE
ncbi:DUF2642 domain-containing protein [Paenibacillus larvae]|uniref:DUF2642 domain-containing protein n=3 Tax=Paenibacillus larvae TaxID=1464 RepID=A0A1V0UNV9_9BACL|nr:DUF2642 domain-containing protein [Paenibacillus larvae]ARF66648.1 DUF2642 domain-containing protein [Paenibacillus larvae subsp. pulvifaciens]AVF21997.1 hypothetical protein ERICI_02142 [Paenibacillus larvae subsp. larvae]AVG11991.1 hypothetical protein ERICII_01591 [Paenibacillus larvae subsp. larvae DSM 25430]ETK27172.1 hypothetical protein ERIC1_1c06140 [Paenibacillus larvae subsp. larvae DSM 25719]MCY7477907.1 YuzF family protein [Paenibacillus larvae]